LEGFRASRRTVLRGAAASVAAAAWLGTEGGGSAWARPGRPGGIRRGPSIQIDPTFRYYQDRSADSIADELAANGYRTVHYFVVNEQNVDDAVITALHGRDIQVWALVIGNGSYSVDGFPADWPSWQMQLLKPIDDGFHRFSQFSAGYLEWKKQSVSALVSRHAFDGVEVAEPYFPEWNGIASGNYGDVGPLAQQAFQHRYGLEIPDFVDASSPRYYRTDTDRYEKWIQLRVDAVNGFLAELVNGRGGIRRSRPDILVATWSLGIDAGPDSVALEREYQGLDAAAMISAIRPDLHFLQTNWPDWLRADLPADYVRTYRPFIEQIRARHPRIPVGVQTDIGSQPTMARDDAWMGGFARTADDLGLTTWTAYEYHLGRYMYQDRPVPKSAHRTADGTAVISFQKRIDADSAGKPDSFEILGDHPGVVAPDAVTVDGNRVLVRTGLPADEPFRLRVSNLTDAPSYWLYNTTGPANPVPSDLIVDIPAATDPTSRERSTPAVDA
jgi:hypothetical protein